MNTDTRQWVIKLFAVVVSAITIGMAAPLIWRVFVDGNAPLTNSITQGFLSDLPQLLLYLTGIILGEPFLTALVARFAGALGVVTVPAAAPTPPPPAPQE